MAHRRAFTVPELLAVIAIIVLLLAMLLPSLNQSRETTRQAICKSNMHQIHLAQVANAAEHRGDLAPHAKWDVMTTYSTSFNNTNWPDTQDKWTGSGLLWYRKYLPEAKVIWCPSLNNPNIAYDNPQWGWRLNPNLTGNKRWMAQPMVQRINVRKINSVTYPGSSSFLSDSMNYSTFYYGPSGESVTYMHKTGYNYVRLDGSTNWYSDKTGYINSLHISGGKGDANAWITMETIFRDYFE